MNSQTLNQPDTRLQQEIDKETQKATDEAEKCLAREAVSAIKETRNAINAIEEENTKAAIAALERATGKLDILVARYPQLGLVPVMTQVSIIDVAPLDLHVIERIRTQLKNAFNNEDFPTARQLLNNLMSEIRTTIVNLPLETYPDAMREAARLLSKGKTDEARTLLQVALSTLVLTEKSRPIPLLNAYTLLVDAVDLAESDPEQRLRFLKDARTQLKLAQELGYARSNPEYTELEQAIQDIERQVRANERTADPLSRLLEKFSSFFKRISGTAPAQPA
ncbi:YfdX family protein [Nostoc sp. CALU 546]|uniref:YfdX family protein n=1 Tax=Nostoc sp. CALU 546 TaxID=1867241 RepID=UPI003B67C041